MEPVEIDAGEYRLRQFHAADRPALIEAFADDDHQRYVLNYCLIDFSDADAYIARRAGEWTRGERCSWAVAVASDDRLQGEVALKDLDLRAGTAEAALWVHPAQRRRGVAVIALTAALRFGTDTLGLHEITYLYHEGNVASATVAQRCGFQFVNSVMSSDRRKLLRCLRVTE